MSGAELLPIQGEHAMALQVPKGTVVRQYVKPVDGPLQSPSRLVVAVGPVSHVGSYHRQAVFGPHRADLPLQLLLGQVGVGIQHRGHHLDLGLWVVVHQPDHGGVVCRYLGGQKIAGHTLHGFLHVAHVAAPCHTPVV